MDATVATEPDERIGAAKSGLLLIADNHDAFAVRALAAREATTSLDLMYYIWHDDHCGRALHDEVIDAADRGVTVRMLIDDINPQSSDAIYLSLDSHPNIDVKLFNPSRMRNGSWFRALEFVTRMHAMTRRMHCKAWIADGRLAIVGGRNVGDEYFDAAETNFRDLDLLMLGPVVARTSEVFEAYWTHRAAWPIGLLNQVKPSRKRQRPRRSANRHIDHDAAIEAAGSISELAKRDEMRWTEGVQVIADPPDKVEGAAKGNWIMTALLPVIRSSQHRLEIVSPYFIPGVEGVEILNEIAGRGVETTVLTNSLAATDVAAVHGAYANYRRRLLRGGVRLYELQPFGGNSNISAFGSKGASLHTKAFAVDDRIGFIGSLNFDPRSVSLNAEMGVLFGDTALVEDLLELFRREKSPESSYRLSLRRGLLRWQGVTDGKPRFFRAEPEASLKRRLLAGIVRRLPIESQL